MVKSKIILLLVAYSLITASKILAQTDRYMVFFTDKDGSTYSIDHPEAFLSDRAIARRIKYHIPVTVQDLPVNSPYVDLVENLDSVSVYHETKWFNGILVEADTTQIPVIKNLAFVSSVRYVAPGKRLKKTISGLSDNSDVLQSSGRIAELANAAQNNMLGINEMHNAGYTGEGKMIAIFDGSQTLASRPVSL